MHGLAAPAALVGRQREWARWAEAAASVAAGRPMVLTIAGPAGIGKTALLGAFRDDVRRQGWVVRSSSNDPSARMLPGHNLFQWFAPLVAATPRGVPPFDGPGEHLHRLVSGEATSTDVTALTFSCAWVARSEAEAQPVVLCVDDLQWCDTLSLQVLAALAPLVHDAPVMLLATLREYDAEQTPDLARSLLERPGAVAMRLDPLDRTGVEAWLRQVRGTAPATVVSLVHAASGGLPFAIGELLADPAWQSAGEPGVSTPRGSSTRMHEVLAGRLDGLGPSQSAVLAAVVLLGEHAVDETVMAAARVDLPTFAGAVEELRAQRLLAAQLPLRPLHPLIGDAARASLPTADAARLQTRIADVLLAEETAADVVASHLLATPPAGRPDHLAVLSEAARSALALGSPAEAAAFADRARAELAAIPASDQSAHAESQSAHAERAELDTLSGTAYRLAGNPAEAISRWRLGLDELPPAERIARLLDLGDTAFVLGHDDEAAATFQRATEAFEAWTTQDPATREMEARIVLRLAGIGLLRGNRLARQHRLVAELMERDLASDGPGERLLLAQEALRRCMLGEPIDECAGLARRSLGDGLLIAEEGSEGTAASMLLAVLINVEADDEAFEVADHFLTHARRNGSVLGNATFVYHRALLHWNRGRLRLALADAETAWSAREFGWDVFVEVVALTLVRVHLERDDLAAAEAIVAAIPLSAPRAPMMQAMAYYAHGLVAAGQGDDERAWSLLSTAAELGESFPGPVWSGWSRDQIEVGVRLGKASATRALADQLVPAAERYGAPRMLGLTLRTAALTHSFATAVPMLRTAIRLLADHEGRVDHGYALVDLAGLLADRGADEQGADEQGEARVTEARVLATRALSLADQAGATRLARRAASLLARLPSSDAAETPTAPESSAVDRLTPSELRVCQLAAQRLTNRQIAERLFVTVKAVEWHLSRSYAKLGIRTRAELSGHFEDD